MPNFREKTVVFACNYLQNLILMFFPFIILWSQVSINFILFPWLAVGTFYLFIFLIAFECLEIDTLRTKEYRIFFVYNWRMPLNQSLLDRLFYSYSCVTTKCDEARINWKGKLRQQFKEFLPFSVHFCAQAVNSFAYMPKYQVPLKSKQ